MKRLISIMGIIIFICIGMVFYGCGERKRVPEEPDICQYICCSNSDCSESTPYCEDAETLDSQCVECFSDGHCGDNETCSDSKCVTIECPGNQTVDMETYYIDQYEASRPDATSNDAGTINSTMACSVAGVLPWTNISWDEAKEACKARGEGWDLCSGSEWEDACDGTPGDGGYVYPYGDTYEGTTCNGGHAEHRKAMPTGYMADCISKKGVYDMSGNVTEWTNEQPDIFTRVLRGGYWTYDIDYLECPYRAFIYSGYVNNNIGFRCCQEK